MAITVKHNKVSAIADGADTTLVRPSDWNDTHSFTGVLDPTNGGTGLSTLAANYIPYGNGTSAFQSSSNLQFNGSSLIANATVSLGGTAGAESLRVVPVASAVNYLQVMGGTTGNAPLLIAQGSDANVSFTMQAKGTGSFYTYGAGSYFYNLASAPQFTISDTPSAVNYLQVQGAPTAVGPVLSAQGSDTNVALVYVSKGNFGHGFYTNSFAQQQFSIAHTASAVNYLNVTGAATGNAPIVSAIGSDTNINLTLTPKGTGSVVTPALSVNSTTSVTPSLSFNASNASIASGATIAGSYLQSLFQNKSSTAGASVNYVLSNDLGTDSTYYGEFGMNSSVYSASTPSDFFSINNGIYFSGHDGDLSIGSGNGYKTYLTFGTSGQSSHVINASGALGLSTNLGTTPALSGTTGFGTTGQVLQSNGSASAPTWVTPASGIVTAVSVASSNGFTGTSSGGATPALTLATSVTGVLKGNGTALSAATANTDYLIPALANTAVSGFKTATFNSQVNNATTTGAITVNWTNGQVQSQAAPTGTITYTFTAPPGVCHLQLLIAAPSTAQTINWPGTVIFMGTTWAGANSKAAVINFWYDGTNYYAIGTNQV